MSCDLDGSVPGGVAGRPRLCRYETDPASETDGMALSHSHQGKFLDRSSGSEAFPGPRYLLGTWPCRVLASCQGAQASTLARCIWRWLGRREATTTGTSSATNPPSQNVARIRFSFPILRRTFWTINPMAFSWKVPDSLCQGAGAVVFGPGHDHAVLVSQGTSVVKRGNRRLVDPHWSRGTSYLKIGWKWVSYALRLGYERLTRHLLFEQRM